MAEASGADPGGGGAAGGRGGEGAGVDGSGGGCGGQRRVGADGGEAAVRVGAAGRPERGWGCGGAVVEGGAISVGVSGGDEAGVGAVRVSGFADPVKSASVKRGKLSVICRRGVTKMTSGAF